MPREALFVIPTAAEIVRAETEVGAAIAVEVVVTLTVEPVFASTMPAYFVVVAPHALLVAGLSALTTGYILQYYIRIIFPKYSSVMKI
ncbi:hypothetical protein FRX31_012875 [Thalictrum thalictroides]|uniref:Uncharacterized protein n=1 Tax=Thalictrum thalictroides TaxID=46969 RepID=A0A7J6WJH0_THATH|nr:hypothetical protein FRX31_012875 [Thalictrum thalictroides]